MVPAAAQPAPAAAKGLAAALSTPAADAAQFRLIAITAGEAGSGDAPPPAQPFPVSTTLLGRVQEQAPKIANAVPPAAAVTEAPTSPSAAMPGPANAIASATDPEPPLASSTRQSAEADMESAVEVPKTGATSLSREQFPAPLAITVTGTGTVPSADTGSPRSASAAPVAAGPQDFAALVGRLAQAREAADPQRVRAALSHAQFGAVSLEFRHEDRGLSVTMASTSAGFTGSVQAASRQPLQAGRPATRHATPDSRPPRTPRKTRHLQAVPADRPRTSANRLRPPMPARGRSSPAGMALTTNSGRAKRRNSGATMADAAEFMPDPAERGDNA
ncbi:hypothetical protein ADT71_11295 [Novosphingobium sp. ST904]|nr:hypothetical protein ADT71_11295 [Novosphingobium sp. ST904]